MRRKYFRHAAPPACCRLASSVWWRLTRRAPALPLAARRRHSVGSPTQPTDLPPVRAAPRISAVLDQAGHLLAHASSKSSIVGDEHALSGRIRGCRRPSTHRKFPLPQVGIPSSSREGGALGQLQRLPHLSQERLLTVADMSPNRSAGKTAKAPNPDWTKSPPRHRLDPASFSVR